MSGFRLINIELDNERIGTDRIRFANDNFDTEENYITLIIGNNGTGKSRLLSSIAKYFKVILSKKSEPIEFEKFEFNRLPSKVIAITNSISDKFPMDVTFRPSQHSISELYHRDLNYNYLGTRNKFNSFSNKALMNRAIEIVFESYKELEISRNYRHIFDYLDYEPIIKVNYKIQSNLPTNSNDEILIFDLLNFVENKNSYRNKNNNEKLLNTIRDRGNEINHFLNYKIRNRENELMINFSSKNIGRIRQDNSIYENNLQEFEILSILRKVGIISSFEIQVFKKGGKPFNFRDASSGEANILSTLLSLVPLLKNNCLLLIDEPEISLHPLWQSRYIDLLNKIFENVSGCHIIIASHSPFLASDLKPNISSVITLKDIKGFISSEIVDKSTYGWSSEDILLNVFKMPSTRNIELYSNVSIALSLLADNNRSKSEFKKIQHNLKEFYPSILENDPIKKVIQAIFEVNINE